VTYAAAKALVAVAKTKTTTKHMSNRTLPFTFPPSLEQDGTYTFAGVKP
jgi:hypothetical protein